MTITEIFSYLESGIRPVSSVLPPRYLTKLYSGGRKIFLNNLINNPPAKTEFIPEEHHKSLWGLNFRCGLMNAAGMFKSGAGYELAVRQGAGAFLAGTVTSPGRAGNLKEGILHPFSPYPNSGAASNWMGLPNEGPELLIEKLKLIKKDKFCPLGISISSSPDLPEDEAADKLLNAFKLFEASNIDFIELNESCPNVVHLDSVTTESGLELSLVRRLNYISANFLAKRERQLPVIVKFSNDLAQQLIKPLIDSLIKLKYDGVNIGNTSTAYELYRSKINNRDLKHFDYFTSNFGGGLSGRILKDNSLRLATMAVEFAKACNAEHEFHVIRTGGIENKSDIAASEKAGIELNQWFTGYFENFARYGHSLYSNIYK